MADKKGILYNEAAKAYFYGDCVSSIEPYGGGHINDTFLARTEKGNFVLQRVNGYVFPHPDEIMDNMVHVTKFLAEKLEKAGKDPKRGTLTVLKTNDGKDYYIDNEGNYWRSTINLENTTAYDFAESPEMLKNPARRSVRFRTCSLIIRRRRCTRSSRTFTTPRRASGN